MREKGPWGYFVLAIAVVAVLAAGITYFENKGQPIISLSPTAIIMPSDCSDSSLNTLWNSIFKERLSDAEEIIIKSLDSTPTNGKCDAFSVYSPKEQTIIDYTEGVPSDFLGDWTISTFQHLDSQSEVGVGSYIFFKGRPMGVDEPLFIEREIFLKGYTYSELDFSLKPNTISNLEEGGAVIFDITCNNHLVRKEYFPALPPLEWVDYHETILPSDCGISTDYFDQDVKIKMSFITSNETSFAYYFFYLGDLKITGTKPNEALLFGGNSEVIFNPGVQLYALSSKSIPPGILGMDLDDLVLSDTTSKNKIFINYFAVDDNAPDNLFQANKKFTDSFNKPSNYPWIDSVVGYGQCDWVRISFGNWQCVYSDNHTFYDFTETVYTSTGFAEEKIEISKEHDLILYSHVISDCNPGWTWQVGTCQADDTAISTQIATRTDCGHEYGKELDKIEDCDYNNRKVIGLPSEIDGNIANLKLKIGSSDFSDTTSYTGEKEIKVYSGSDLIMQFDWDFSTPLNLREITIEKQSSSDDYGYLIVKGLDAEKTFYVDKVGATNTLCIEDDEDAEDVSDVSEFCSKSNEYLIECPGSRSIFDCVVEGDKFVVSTLENSIVLQGNFEDNSGETCTSDCGTKECGSNGCPGGTCGTCDAGEICDEVGVCAPCVPSCACASSTCIDDTCTNNCGTPCRGTKDCSNDDEPECESNDDCLDKETCKEGACVPAKNNTLLIVIISVLAFLIIVVASVLIIVFSKKHKQSQISL